VEVGETSGNAQALLAKFSSNRTTFKAKGGEAGCLVTVESWGKGVYASYTPPQTLRHGIAHHAGRDV